jgi:hypothetical protein
VRACAWLPGAPNAPKAVVLRAGPRLAAVLAAPLAAAVLAGGAATPGAGGGPVPAVTAAVPAVGSWGRATGVPGLKALNKHGGAKVNEVSCVSAGNCAAGGNTDGSGHQQAFVASERNGRWGRATGVTGLGR